MMLQFWSLRGIMVMVQELLFVVKFQSGKVPKKRFLLGKSPKLWVDGAEQHNLQSYRRPQNILESYQ